MLTGLDHLSLEVKYLDRAREFYAGRLGLDPTGGSESGSEVGFDVGGTRLLLRRPGSVPRGGLHTHYAFSTPRSAYEAWRDRVADLDVEEFDFGMYRSLYFDDPDGHCVEIGNLDDGSADGRNRDPDRGEGSAPPLTGIFEVVLEVGEIGPAEAAYRELGFEVVDRGDERRRVRLRGPMDLELWEPQLGIADARGGVHVDVGFRTDEPAAAAAAMGDWVVERESVADGVRVRERDGHYVTFVRNA